MSAILPISMDAFTVRKQTEREKLAPKLTPLACLHVQRGHHLDFLQAVADAVKTAAERAEEIDDSLKTFMFVIPKV